MDPVRATRLKRTLLPFLVLVAGCKDAYGQVPDLPKAPTARLAPAKHTKWPAVPRGFIRIDSLGIDVQSPHDDALEYVDIDSAEITWEGPRGHCELQLAVDVSERPERSIVGTQPIACYVHGEGCGSQCGEIRSIRGGPAEESYPSEPPVIEIKSAWSDRAKDRAGLLVWREGTVQFYGEQCRGYRGRRGSLPAPRVAALVDALDRGGLLTHQVAHQREGDRRDPMCEHAVTWFTIRSATRRNSIMSNCEVDEVTRSALSLVDRVVGPNPCLPKSEGR
jgi:hypothetical protein